MNVTFHIGVILEVKMNSLYCFLSFAHCQLFSLPNTHSFSLVWVMLEILLDERVILHALVMTCKSRKSIFNKRWWHIIKVSTEDHVRQHDYSQVTNCELASGHPRLTCLDPILQSCECFGQETLSILLAKAFLFFIVGCLRCLVESFKRSSNDFIYNQGIILIIWI